MTDKSCDEIDIVDINHLYSAAIKKTGDSYFAEEITQDTLLAAYTALSRGFMPDNRWAWLLRILSNKYHDRLREKYRHPVVNFDARDGGMDEIPDDGDVIDRLFEQAERSEQLNQMRYALAYLARTHREVLLRFYLHGETLEEISRGMAIPVGTVKSRLNTGKRYLREGMIRMDDYTKQSYEPDWLHISCSGECGAQDEPFSLVKSDDKLTQNLLILAYPKPVSETELAKLIGVPVVYIEPIVDRMIDSELMKRTDGGKVYTDFIIYTREDRFATLEKQLTLVEHHFDSFWEVMDKALTMLRERDYYKRQREAARNKLTLHFLIKLLVNASVSVRDEVTGAMPYADYPYRKDGGRWIAMGMLYRSGDASEDTLGRYAISGEAGIDIRNYHGTRSIELRKYDTTLGGYPNQYLHGDPVKWLYEIAAAIPAEQSEVVHRTLDAADRFLESGILKKDGALALDIPLLLRSEYHDETMLSACFVEPLAAAIHDDYIKLFTDGFVRLPSHLKSVPTWQRYMFCGDSVQMAVILKAIEKGLLFKGVDEVQGKLPAALLIVDKPE